jgi:hypothetical protein
MNTSSCWRGIYFTGERPIERQACAPDYSPSYFSGAEGPTELGRKAVHLQSFAAECAHEPGEILLSGRRKSSTNASINLSN